MAKTLAKFLPKARVLVLPTPTVGTILFYAMIIFLVRFADGIMAYFAPVYIESHVNDPLLMGLIIAASSVIGLICDIIYGEWFAAKKYHFFLFWGLLIAAVFPLSFLLLPAITPVFIVSMTIWGIYYELIRFSDFNFINHQLSHQFHATGWGVLIVFIAGAYMLAPSVAAYLLNVHENLPPLGSLASLSLASLGFFILILARKSKSSFGQLLDRRPKNLLHQLKIWHALIPVLWPVLLFVFTLTILDAAFWTSGAILSEMYKTQGLPGGILFIAYLSPALFMGMLTGRLAKPFGKKKMAFLSGLAAGATFFAAGLTTSAVAFLVAVFTGSIFIAIASPEIYATIEDYVSRLGHASNSMIGLQNSMANIAFIIGSILAGLIAGIFSHQHVFTFIGVLLVIVSAIALLVTPRKIRLPQQAIHRLEDFLNR